jgi:transcriptional regulator with XRE-family HTH domain
MATATKTSSVTKLKQELSAAIIDERNRRGWTQTDLAEKANVTQPRVSEIEGAVRDYRISSLERILKALNLKLFVAS